MNSREVLARLRAAGWTVQRTVGSHHQLNHPTQSGKVTIPHPKKTLPIGTLKSIEKQSGVKLRG